MNVNKQKCEGSCRSRRLYLHSLNCRTHSLSSKGFLRVVTIKTSFQHPLAFLLYTMPHEDFDSDDNGNSEPELPPVKGLMLDRINDIMDYETEHIIFDRTTRADHFDCLERFWDLHPANSICYGRRYCLLYMCELLCICCSSSPYGDDGTPSPDLSTIQRDPLYGFNKARWETVQDDLKKVKKLLLRKDATINFTSGDDADEEGQGKQVDLGRAKSACFADKFQLVMDLISVNKMLGPIRKKLEDLIRANAGNFTKAIGKKHIQAVFDSVQEEKDMNSNLKKHILSLFVDRNSFVEDDKLTRLLNDKVFDLFKVQTRIERLIIAMWHQVYKGRVGHGVCTLMKLRYGIVRGSNIAKIVQRTPKQRTLGPEEEVRELRKTRKVLNDDHGNDPLDDALEATGGRKKKRRPLDPDETHSSRPAAMRRNKRKPDAPEDGFEDDQDDNNMMPQDDNDDEEDDDVDKQMEYESEDDLMESLNKEEKRDQVLLNRGKNHRQSPVCKHC